MNLSVHMHDRHAAVLCVQGSVDGATYGQLTVQAQQLLGQGARFLVLDLSDCDYMSSAGLISLTSIWKQMRALTLNEKDASWATKNVLERAGELGPARQLVLVNPRAGVRQVLTLAGVQAYIPIFESTEQALQVAL